MWSPVPWLSPCGVGRSCEGPLQSILAPNPSVRQFAALDEAGLNCFNF